MQSLVEGLPLLSEALVLTSLLRCLSQAGILLDSSPSVNRLVNHLLVNLCGLRRPT
jgi:hypothetical protein